MSERSAGPAGRAGETLFLDAGVLRGIRTLVGDFVNFTLVLVFYPLCWIFGGAAFLIDNMFRTGLFDRFIRLVEHIDNSSTAVKRPESKSASAASGAEGRGVAVKRPESKDQSAAGTGR